MAHFFFLSWDLRSLAGDLWMLEICTFLAWDYIGAGFGRLFDR
jgi:hypothetical protein